MSNFLTAYSFVCATGLRYAKSVEQARYDALLKYQSHMVSKAIDKFIPRYHLSSITEVSRKFSDLNYQALRPARDPRYLPGIRVSPWRFCAERCRVPLLNFNGTIIFASRCIDTHPGEHGGMGITFQRFVPTAFIFQIN